MDRFSAVPIAVFTVAVRQISTAADIPTKAPLTTITPFPVYNWTDLYVSGKVVNTFAASIGLRNTTSSGGWTVRGGIEYAFNPFAAAGVEYNLAHINITDRDQSVSPNFVTPETLTGENADIQTVWAPLNVRLAPLTGVTRSTSTGSR